MERRRFLLGTVAATAPLFAGCSNSGGSTPGGETPADEPTTDPPTDTPATTPPSTPDDPVTDYPSEVLNGSFEDGLSAWTVGRDLPEDPNNSGQPVDSSVETTTERASDGSTGLRISIDGSADDGTVWVQQTVDPEDVSTLKVDGYSKQNSFNTVLQVATYVGPEPETGLVEEDFDREHSLWDHEGWKTYEYDVDLPDDGPAVVAVGLNIVWETGAAGVLDNVRLE